MGMIQYTIGATAGAFVGMFHNGTGLPMVMTMACCAFMGSIAVMCAHRLNSIQHNTLRLFEAEAEA
jgi:DHA1 family bicyclomycin/chloramphenicol resistance-like MFS transporter